MKSKTLKEMILAGLTLLLLSMCVCGAERKSPRDLMIIGRDYNLWEDISARPVSVGLNSWYTVETGVLPAIYASAAVISYKDIVRLELGGSATWNSHRRINGGSGSIDMALLTGVSTLIADRIVVGIWFAPFWNLYGSKPDDAFGGMIGYAFSL